MLQDEGKNAKGQKEKIRELEEKLKSLEEETQKRGRLGVAGEALQTIGGLFQGLSKIVASFESSETFRKRLEALDKRIEEGIRCTGEIKDVAGVKGARMRYNYSVRTLIDDGLAGQNLSNARKRTGSEATSEKRDPLHLIDVFEEDDRFRVIAELPGVKGLDDIKLSITNNVLIISVDAAKYYREVAMPSSSKTEIAKAKYANGVLEVEVEKAR